MTDNCKVIEVNGLKKYFRTPMGNLHAVDDVNFSIYSNETLGIVGESGCGKSTLGRTILRLHEPTSGTVKFRGEDILKFNKRKMKTLRQHMQIIFQDPFASLNPRMTTYEAISEALIIQHPHIAEAQKRMRVKKMMSLVGLSERLINTYPHELDGGRRQRIGIARALILEPDFIVCDEPVSALDVSIQAQILNLMQDVQKEMSLTYMFISHDLSVVKHISDRVAVMYLGQIIEIAPANDIFDKAMHPYTKALLSAIPIPDPDDEQERIILKGEINSPIEPKPICRFAKRCPNKMAICERQSVELLEIDEKHKVACLLYDKGESNENEKI